MQETFSADTLSSPERLNRQIHVIRPGVWVALSLLILALVAGIVWASVTTIEIRRIIPATSENGRLTLTLTKELNEQLSLLPDTAHFTSQRKLKPNTDIDVWRAYAPDEEKETHLMSEIRYIGEKDGEWLYDVPTSLPEGDYWLVAVGSTFHPIELLTN